MVSPHKKYYLSVGALNDPDQNNYDLLSYNELEIDYSTN